MDDHSFLDVDKRFCYSSFHKVFSGDQDEGMIMGVINGLGKWGDDIKGPYSEGIRGGGVIEH